MTTVGFNELYLHYSYGKMRENLRYYEMIQFILWYITS